MKKIITILFIALFFATNPVINGRSEINLSTQEENLFNEQFDDRIAK